MNADRAMFGRLGLVVAAVCGTSSTLLAQGPQAQVIPMPGRTAQPAVHPPTIPTRPQPRLILEPGKPWVYTTVPQPLGTVPVVITRAPRQHSPQYPGSPSGYPAFERPFRTGGGLGGVPAKFPNVLSRSPSYVKETFGPVLPNRGHHGGGPWSSPVETRPHWNRVGDTRSMIGPSGVVYSTNGSSVTAGGAAVSSGRTYSEGSSFSADIDLGNVQVHIGSRPPIWPASGSSIWGTYCFDRPDWNGGGGGGTGWCGTKPPCWDPCRPVCPPTWDNGWWTWYDSVGYYGPVYGTSWINYDPALFYPPSVTDPAPAADASAAQPSELDQLVGFATALMVDGRYGDAAKALRDYMRREPTDAGAGRWLAMALLAQRKTKDAVYEFLRAYESSGALSDLPLEYEAMGFDRSDLRRMSGPLITYARVTKSAGAYLMASVIMDARGMQDQAKKLLTEARTAGLDAGLAGRVEAGFAK
ncbi:MAG: hypothetical protein GIKADHBN_02356 [Phycisphaerales bacterium]|nr:hypothetical protein [Phycisphaerales bacterium]